MISTLCQKICVKKYSSSDKKTYSDITKKGGQINKDKEATDKTFNSHPNRSSAQVMENKGEDNISLCSTIISESDWEESIYSLLGVAGRKLDKSSLGDC